MVMAIMHLERGITEIGVRVRLVQVLKKVQNNAAHSTIGRAENGGHKCIQHVCDVTGNIFGRKFVDGLIVTICNPIVPFITL